MRSISNNGHHARESGEINNADRPIDQDQVIKSIIDEWLVPLLVNAFVREIEASSKQHYAAGPEEK
jgi:hypothetical protein